MTSVPCFYTINFQNLFHQVWGTGIKEDIFQRWTQGILCRGLNLSLFYFYFNYYYYSKISKGMVFSAYEPSALVQFEGGPCAILAPVQAFLLKNLLQNKITEDWKKVNNSNFQINFI